MLFSFIDYGLKDFLRDQNNEVIKKEFTCQEAAEDWLLDNVNDLDWTNQGTEYYVWED